MGKVLILSENDSLIEKYSKIFEGKFFSYEVCKTEKQFQDITENNFFDIYLADENIVSCNLKQILQRIKNVSENSRILLVSQSGNDDSEILSNIDGYIIENY